MSWNFMRKAKVSTQRAGQPAGLMREFLGYNRTEVETTIQGVYQLTCIFQTVACIKRKGRLQGI